MMKEMRRKDRQLTEQDALHILQEAEYGVLSTVTPEGIPYGLPINYALEGRSLYMHCSAEGGQKLLNITHCPEACMTAVTGVLLHSQQLSTAFRSAMAFGRVTVVTELEEKRAGLRILMHRLAPEYNDHDPDCMQDAPLARCHVLRMDIDTVTGKEHL